MSEPDTGAEFDPCRLLTPALEVAIAAGCSILEVYERGFEIEHKHDSTPLTEADLAAHHIIEEGLRQLTPELPILSEESAHIPFSTRRSWSRYWLVDPLDGTAEFIKRTGEFSVNIALIDHHEPVVGIVYAPALGIYYYACRDQGAYRREATQQPERIEARRWDGGRVIIAGSRSWHSEQLNTFLHNLPDHIIMPMGSAMKICMVAEGRADLYPRLGPTSEWDTAAGQCILEEAGGRITDVQMQSLRYNTKDELLNPYFFASGGGEVDWSRYLEEVD